MGQDWSEVWLQRFSGTVTVWPKSIVSDYWHILSDPTPQRLGRMIHVGQLAAWPKLKFIGNRMAIEKVIEEAREATRPSTQALPTPLPDERTLKNVLSQDDLQVLLEKAKADHAPVEVPPSFLAPSRTTSRSHSPALQKHDRAESPSLSKRFSGWLSGRQSPRSSTDTLRPTASEIHRERLQNEHRNHHRRGSVMEELRRQSGVFWDDLDAGTGEETVTEDEDGDDEHLVQDEDDVAPYESGSGRFDSDREAVLSKRRTD